MPAPPARRRSFLSLESSVEDGKRALTKHRSFTGFSHSSLLNGGTPPRTGEKGALPSALQLQQLNLPRLLSTRRVLIAAAALILMLTFLAGSQWCSESTRTSAAAGGRWTSTGHNSIQRGGVYRNISASGLAYPGSTGLPPDPEDRPYYDLVVAVLVVGGDSEEAQEEIARVRRVYSRYGSGIVPGGGSDDATPLTFKVIFVVGRAGLPEGMELGEAGLLLGDFYHVDVREGYRYLSDKTKAMTGLADHFRFTFFAKTDGDTYPCLSRVTGQLMELPVEDRPKVYAGLLNRCGTVFPKRHKLYDPEFQAATGGTLSCHPMYHQGAFYVLGQDLVNHLNRSRDMLTVMSVEDAMVGLWLLGIDKVILDIGGSFYCKCYTHPIPEKKASFYHFCKTDEKMNKCLRDFGVC
ncbi:unnamed protein product [Scytosiphon promiscuus]